MFQPYVSIVIPVHNEEESLEKLYQRIMPVLNELHKNYEVIFINDGSTDGSEALLDFLYNRSPEHLRIIHLNGNYGQHLAIMAGFEKVRGEIIITLDADLQNLPEDIPHLIKKMEEGYDVVSGYRQKRQDVFWRKWVSRIYNKVRAKIMPKLTMKDQGCMLRAYRRRIVDLMVAGNESTTFIPALALSYANRSTEIPIGHDARAHGHSKYNFYKLVRQNFDLITNFSLAPLQIFTLAGIGVSLFSGFLVLYLLIRRLIDGPEAQGVFTLFAIAFFLIGLCLLGLGILGEYIGRIYQQVRQRPRFMIRRIQENSTHES